MVNRRKILNLLLKASGFVILAILLARVDFQLILKRFDNFKWYKAGIVYLIFFPIYIIKSFNVR